MKRLNITANLLRINMAEKIKLYNLYGKDFDKELSNVFDRLAKVLNSDDAFTNAVIKRLPDYEKEESILDKLKLHLLTKLYSFTEEQINTIYESKSVSEITDKTIIDTINNIMSDPNENAYFDVFFSIEKRLFNDIVSYYLHKYIVSKDLALDNTEGIKDYKQCDFIIERYHNYQKLLDVDGIHSSLSFDENGCVIFKKGDLFHGTEYNKEKLENISKSGLETGRLHGSIKDGETFFCIDFFKVQNNSSANDICNLGKQYTNEINNIVFVINREDVDSESAMFPSITNYDVYNDATDEGRQTRKMLNIKDLKLNSNIASSILIGVPSSIISSIIVNSDVENNKEKIEYIRNHFPKTFIISRTTGKVISKPIEDNKRRP